MNIQTTTMDPETSPILTALAEWWKVIASIGGVIGGFFAFLKARKIKLSKVLKAVYGWCGAVARLPITLGEIQAQLRMKDGRGFDTWAENVDQTLVGVRRTLALETSLRRVSMQGISEALFEANAEGHFQWVNTAFLEKAGVRIDDVRGNNWWNIITVIDREDFVDAWYKQVSQGNHFKGKFRLNVDGPDRWMMFDATCNRDDLGQVLGYLGYLRETADPRIHKSE